MSRATRSSVVLNRAACRVVACRGIGVGVDRCVATSSAAMKTKATLATTSGVSAGLARAGRPLLQSAACASVSPSSSSSSMTR